jgi:hypothetical protein
VRQLSCEENYYGGIVSLAPKWARPVAILGLKMQLLQLRIALSQTGDAPQEILLSVIESYEEELHRIDMMKD